MLGRLADWLGSHLLEIAAYLLRYAEHHYGPPADAASSFSPENEPPAELPPRIQALVEELEQNAK